MDNQNKTQGIPTFTPPEDGAPVFTPPKTPQHDGPVCYHHPSEPAVARCARCGKYICKDCAEAYTVTGGEYANKCLCFDCCEQLVAENVAELTKNKNKIKGQFILQLIGMVIGFIYGMGAGITSGDIGGGFLAGLICACIGGVFLSALKAFGSLTWEAIKIAFSGNFGVLTVISIIFQIIVIVFKCIWITISNTIQYILYLKRTQGFIESDSAALQQMRDYMEYTLVRNQNKGVDLEDLMNEGSELYNNSYAQAVRDISGKSKRTIKEAQQMLADIDALDARLSQVDKYYRKTKEKKEAELADKTSDRYQDVDNYFAILEQIKGDYAAISKKYSEDILPALINGLNYLFSSKRKKDYEELIILRNTLKLFEQEIEEVLPTLTTEELAQQKKAYCRH